MLWILVATSAIVLGYWFLVRPHRYWADRGVKQGKPVFILGDTKNKLFRTQPFAQVMQNLYDMAPDARYFGFYDFLKPILLVRDPDLIKEMLIIASEHFVDRISFIPQDVDPLWGTGLVEMTGERWQQMRRIVTPAFTVSKIKLLFSSILQNCEHFTNYFLEKDGTVTVEMKDVCTRFTIDVIVNIVFGVECDSLKDRNNEFFLMGMDVINFNGFWQTIKLINFTLIPSFYKFFKITYFSKKVIEFFNGVVKNNIKNREEHGIVRPDVIHLLLEERKNRFKYEESRTGQKYEITDEVITSQAFVLFLAGFNTVSTLMPFVAYELAVHPELQERLIQEVDETLNACAGKITYDALVGMKYMHMVVSETFRKWPHAFYFDRVCTKPYTIKPKHPGEKPVHLETGSEIWVPLLPIHRDSKYYPDPERFDPERFSDENKHKIKSSTFLTFGIGPRQCIGSRIGFLVTKLLFFYVLAHFDIVPIEKTQIPVQLDKKDANLAAEAGIWLGLKRRVKT